MKGISKKVGTTVAALVLAGAMACALVGCGGGSSAGTQGNAGGSSSIPNSNETTETITIGTLATEDILPMWVAESEGLFTEHGLKAEVTVFQSATELIAGVTSGEVDVAMTDPMVTASIHVSGTPVRIEWVTLGATAAEGRFGIMTADASVKSLADLKGKDVGVGSNTILEYVMDKLIERAGIAEGDIAKAELQKLPVRYQAMASGQVAAAALPASLLALGEAEGYTVVADDTQGDNLSQSVMIARDGFLGGAVIGADGATMVGTEAIEKLKSVWNAAVKKINAAPESYRSLLAQKANLSEKVAGSYPMSTYPECAMPAAKDIEAVLQWMAKKGYIASGVTYDATTGVFVVK